MDKILKNGLRWIMTTGPEVSTGGKMSTVERKEQLLKKVFFYGSLPLIVIFGSYCMWDMFKKKEKPEFVPYEYLRIRRSRSFGADRDKPFSHNKEMNELAHGYEI